MRLPEPSLLVVTDRRQARLPLVEVVRAAVAAGCRWVSLREKDLDAGEQIALAQSLLPIVRRYGGRLSVHGDPDLARACGADGVHLPSGSDAAAARRRLGRDRFVGISIHSAAEAAVIDPAQADYAIAGPAYETPSKPGYGPEIGRKGLAEVTGASRVPVLAIGGINAVRMAEVLAAGAAGVAVMGSVMRTLDPGQEVRALIAPLTGAASQPRPR